MKEPRESLLYAIGGIEDEWIADAVRAQPPAQKAIRPWMKYAVAACLAVAILVCVPAVVNSGTGSRDSTDSAVAGDLIPMLYVNGTVFYASEIDPLDRWQSEFQYLGTITSAVESDRYPEEEFQSNDANAIGAPVYRYGENLVLGFDGQYWIYTATPGE